MHSVAVFSHYNVWFCRNELVLEPPPYDIARVERCTETEQAAIAMSRNVLQRVGNSQVIRAMLLCQGEQMRRSNLLLYVQDAATFVDLHPPLPTDDWLLVEFGIENADAPLGAEGYCAGWRHLVYEEEEDDGQYMGFYFREPGRRDWDGFESYYTHRTHMVLVYDDNHVDREFYNTPSMEDIAAVWMRDVNVQTGVNIENMREDARRNMNQNDDDDEFIY